MLDEAQREQREYFERERVEQQRREDVLEERAFWQNVFLCVFEGANVVSTATEKADAALVIYKERFE